MGQQNTKSNLSLKIISSENQSQYLYDYHKYGIYQDQKHLKSTAYLFHFGETVKIVYQDSIDNLNYDLSNQALFQITQDQYQQVKFKSLKTQNNTVLWKVIQQKETYPLNIGQTIKIGKIQLKLKRIINESSQRQIEQVITENQKQSINLNSINEVISDKGSSKSENPRCRICFMGYTNKTDPLLNLCKCTGSIKHIHFSCLKDWISNGIQKKQQQHYQVYTFAQMKCQLCKHQLPTNFKHKGKQYSFLEQEIEAPYAQFEGCDQQNGIRKYNRYLINLRKQKEILVGRSNSCQVVIKDISVSRIHCCLEYKHGMLFLRDKKSKFGTLIKIQEESNVEFSLQQGIKLQYESNLIELNRKGLMKGCCCKLADNYKLVYEKSSTSENRNDNLNDRREIGNNNQIRPIVTRGYEYEDEQQYDNNSQLNQSMMRTRIRLYNGSRQFRSQQ